MASLIITACCFVISFHTERKNKPKFIHPSVFSTDGYKLKLNAENTRILCKILPSLLHYL